MAPSIPSAKPSAIPPPKQCPCCSDKPFAQCCGRYLDSGDLPKTAKQLMRSRYSAYALGGYGKYLLESWHADTVPTSTAEALSRQELDWKGLRIVNYSQQGDTGSVSFEATYVTAEGITGIHRENSRFLRINGKWLYLDGQE